MSKNFVCSSCYAMYSLVEEAEECCGYMALESGKRITALRGALLLSGSRARGAIFDDTQALHVVYEPKSKVLVIQRGASTVRVELEGGQGEMLWVDGIIANVRLTPIRERDWVVFVVEISLHRAEAGALPTPRMLTTRV